MTNEWKIWALKGIHPRLGEWMINWPAHGKPSLQDFKNAYGDEFYEPFHTTDEIVELVEKVSAPPEINSDPGGWNAEWLRSQIPENHEMGQ